MSELPVDVPPHIAETIHAIALLHAEHHRKSTIAERIVDRATTAVGQPKFLLALIGVVGVWMTINAWVALKGGTALDSPPFASPINA